MAYSRSSGSLYIQLCKELAWESSLVKSPWTGNSSYPQGVTVSAIARFIGRDDGLNDPEGLAFFLENYVPIENDDEDYENVVWARCDYKVMTYHEYKNNTPQLPELDKVVQDSEKLLVLFPPQYKLSMELQQLYESLKPDTDLERRRQAVVRKITHMLGTSWPGAGLKVELFGSSAGGHSFNSSDLDLSIVVPQERLDTDVIFGLDLFHELDSFYNMDVIAAKLQLIGMTDVRPIKKAAVPICKFVDPTSMLRCDISTHNAIAIKNTQMIKYYIGLDPRVRSFIYAIKYFSKERVINDSYRGTLTSYAYIMMALFYLTTLDPPVLPNIQKLTKGKTKSQSMCVCEKKQIETILNRTSGSRHIYPYYRLAKHNVAYHNCVRMIYPEDDFENTHINLGETPWICENTQTVAELLLGFFRFFSHGFNYGLEAVSLRHGLHRVKDQDWKRSAIAVQDPFITKRNVSYTCTTTGARLIKREFGRALAMLNNGSTFEKVCGKPDLQKRAFDPDTIEQKYRGYQPKHNNLTSISYKDTLDLALATKMMNSLFLNSEEREEEIEKEMEKEKERERLETVSRQTVEMVEENDTIFVRTPPAPRPSEDINLSLINEDQAVPVMGSERKHGVTSERSKVTVKPKDEPEVLQSPTVFDGEPHSHIKSAQGESKVLSPMVFDDGSRSHIKSVQDEPEAHESQTVFKEEEPTFVNAPLTTSSETLENSESEPVLFTLKNVPNHVDRLDILHTLDWYGQVLAIDRAKLPADTVMYDYGTDAEWIVELILDASHTSLPTNLELVNERISATRLIIKCPT